MKFPKELTTVTPLSKYLAMVVFVAFPFIGFFMGMRYQEMLDVGKRQQEEMLITTPKRRPTPTPTPTVSHPTPTPSPLVLPTVDPSLTANWKMYKNAKYGYSFNYPQTWNVKEIDNTFKSKIVPSQMVSMTEIGDSETKIQIFFEGEFDHGLDPRILEKKETINLGGKTANKEIYNISNNSDAIKKNGYKWINISIDNFHSFRIELIGAPSLVPTFDQILSTFKFTN